MTDVARGSTPQVDKPVRAEARGQVPGDSSMWFFVIGDLLIFGGYFVGYMYYRGRNHELFLAGQAQLNLDIGTVNTIVLLTSSLFVALGTAAARVGTGVGISWKTPFGLINIDIAQAVVKQKYDQTQLFRFGFGTRF